MRSIYRVLQVSLLVAPSFVLGPVALRAEPEAQWEWIGIPRVIAVGDLHGSYDKAVRLLQAADLLDGELRWVGGDTHLVVAGDILDRGTGDRQLMDLFRRLQPESQELGGRVHLLLGNHEAMNLMRDLRYVNSMSFRSFVNEEGRSDRQAAWRAFSRSAAKNSNATDLSSEFQRDFPPGYFGRQRSLDPDGEYGAWLLTLPTIVKINDVVYLHGGLTVETAAMGLDGINRQMIDTLRRHLRAREVLARKGIVTPVMEYGEIRQVARAADRRGERIPRQLSEAARELVETGDSLLLGSGGPLWYRGNAFEDERIEREMLERALELLHAETMVVAHSPTSGKRITSRFHGRLFRIDHNISDSEMLQALVLDHQEIMVFDATTKQTRRPVWELPTGTPPTREADQATDEVLEEFLARAEVIDWRLLGRGSTRPRLVELEMSGSTRRGIFKTVADDSGSGPNGLIDRYQHELAAYLVDRMIGLQMVPVTAYRQIEGQPGSLQSWIEGAVDQEAADAYDLGLFATDGIAKQLARAAVFDALIGNRDRKPGDILCTVQGERLYLIDHSKAFSTSSEIYWDQGGMLTVDADLATALQALERASLLQELGELLSERQIEALLERREKILASGATIAGEGSRAEGPAVSGGGGIP